MYIDVCFICLVDWGKYANIPTKRSKFTLF